LFFAFSFVNFAALLNWNAAIKMKKGFLFSTLCLLLLSACGGGGGGGAMVPGLPGLAAFGFIPLPTISAIYFLQQQLLAFY
jgi:hypothetical protein